MAKKRSIYDKHLPKNPANHVALSPLSFLERSAFVYPNHIALVHGEIRRTWKETYTRAQKLASALSKIGIGYGDTVSVMAPNIPAIYEAHFGVPMTGAVLNTLNIRLDPATIAFMLQHAETKVLLTDKEFSPTIQAALAILKKKPLVIDIDDLYAESGELIGSMEYEAFLNTGDDHFDWQLPANEWNAISLNYTSGTTGNPKGVVYHHRGAHLNAINNILAWGMPPQATYLWTLPMFHCNGWCFPWTMAAISGTNICLRKVKADDIFRAIATEKVTHFCGAPIVLGMLNNAKAEDKMPFQHKVSVMTAGAAPPAAIIEGMESQGFNITHTYGLTECYGPTVVCAWHGEWDELPISERAGLKARQGVRYHFLEGLEVADPETLKRVPADGQTMGEIMMQGNNVMKGYLKNPKASEEAFKEGWFRTGDLAVKHPDGYIQIRDRSKDIIISGGENISTIEVEGVLYRHPSVLEAAVVARPDEKWGETVCAFIFKKAGDMTTEADIITFCKKYLAGFKAPKTVIFSELPKTSTGKIQKFVLRDKAKAL
jgi:fatty-acyl-CoA synthase